MSGYGVLNCLELQTVEVCPESNYDLSSQNTDRKDTKLVMQCLEVVTDVHEFVCIDQQKHSTTVHNMHLQTISSCFYRCTQLRMKFATQCKHDSCIRPPI